MSSEIRLKAALAGYDAQYGIVRIGDQHPELPKGATERIEAVVEAARQALSNPVRGEGEKAIVDCERCGKTLERIGSLRGADYWLCDCSVRETTNYGSQRYEVVRADEGRWKCVDCGADTNDDSPCCPKCGSQTPRADEDSQGEGERRWTIDYCPEQACGWMRPADGDGPLHCPYDDSQLIRAVVRDG